MRWALACLGLLAAPLFAQTDWDAAALAAAREGSLAEMRVAVGRARWSRWWAQSERDAGLAWVTAVNARGIGHPNMSAPTAGEGTLGDLMPATLRTWFWGNAAASRAFWEAWTEVDNPISVSSILGMLWAADEVSFRTRPALAIAIALVYDVPPPPDWPHGQVSARALPRQLPEPVSAFRYWTEEYGARRTSPWAVADLIHVVDTPAPLIELVASRPWWTAVHGDLTAAYEGVRYNFERVETDVLDWPGSDYRLATIREFGGICVDQAYYAAVLGKARGVPTLIFLGTGNESRHAWLGYARAPGAWNLEAARYPEQGYDTGVTYDPQTWERVSDEAFAYQRADFLKLPGAKLAAELVERAQVMAAYGALDEAAATAAKACQREPRLAAAWQARMAIAGALEQDAATREALARAAMRALRAYPEKHAWATRIAVAALRERGESSLAEQEERMLAIRLQAGRADLTAEHLGDIMRDAQASGSPLRTLATFRRLVGQYGQPGGMSFFDAVTRPTLERARRGGDRAIARHIAAVYRQVVPISPGSQLDRELASYEVR